MANQQMEDSNQRFVLCFPLERYNIHQVDCRHKTKSEVSGKIRELIVFLTYSQNRWFTLVPACN